MAVSPTKTEPKQIPGKQSQALVTDEKANELVFAVVGHVGSGTTAVAEVLRARLMEEEKGIKYDVHILKARQAIIDWASGSGKALPSEDRTDLTVVIRTPCNKRWMNCDRRILNFSTEY